MTKYWLGQTKKGHSILRRVLFPLFIPWYAISLPIRIWGHVFDDVEDWLNRKLPR